MAQKPAIILNNEARAAFINTINYFIQQGIPTYELKNIFDAVSAELNSVVEKELKQAETEYKEALEQEENNEKAE